VSTLNVNTVEPAGATLTIGESGDTVKANDSVNVNTVKDAGGNTIWVSDGSGNLSSVDSAFGDALVLLSTQTASADSEIDFTSDIDSAYKEYVFKFINIHPETDQVFWRWQASTDSGSNYDTTCTSTTFRAYHSENGSSSALEYFASADAAQSTSMINLAGNIGNDNDQSLSGAVHLFNPSSTTYVKNWYFTGQFCEYGDYSMEYYSAGYFNTTSAIDAIRFNMTSGDTDAGTIKMYGVK